MVTTSRRSSPQVETLRKDFAGRFEHVICDLGDTTAVAGLVERVGLIHGFDGFVANAAQGTEGLLTLSSDAEIQNCVQVNLIAPILLARGAIKGMLKRGGSLVFISSIAARTGLKGLSVYSATKGALVSFSRALAREYGERGIRSNCILPGYLATDMSRSVPEETRERLARRTALKRLGEVRDVVGAVAFLLSEEARYITGTEIVVDGGFSG